MLWPQIWFNPQAGIPQVPQGQPTPQRTQTGTVQPSVWPMSSMDKPPMTPNQMATPMPMSQRIAGLQDKMELATPMAWPQATEDAFPMDKIMAGFGTSFWQLPTAGQVEEQMPGVRQNILEQWDMKKSFSKSELKTLLQPLDKEQAIKFLDGILANGYEVIDDAETPTQESNSFQEFITPIASFSQWVSDIGQGIIWKPIERAAKNTLKLFWFSDEELEWLSTRWDITPALWEAGETMVAKWSRELGRIAGTAALTAWMPFALWVKLAGKWWAELIKAVAKRTLVWWAEWLAWAAAYNLWATDELGEPINLTTAAGIWAALWWPLSLIWSRVVAPWINALANKLQLSGLLNRSRLDRLSTILKQWGADELAAGTPEDVSNWMFQRNIKGSKEQIIKQLDSIADWSMEMLDNVLASSTSKHAPEWLSDMLNVLKQEYDGAISAGIKSKGKRVDELIQKLNNEWWLTLSEINEVKKAINKDLNVFTASGKVKISKDDIASANRQLKQYLEQTIEQEGLSEIPVKLLNNEYAMASSMKKAIEEKLNTDMIGEILSFVNNRGWSSIGWALLWSQAWPFDNNTIEGKLGNIITGFLVGRFIGSTQAKTTAASLLKKINPQQKAQILKYIERGGEWTIPPQAKKVLQTNLNVDDISLPSNIYDDVSNSNVWQLDQLPSPTSTPVDALPM